MPVEIDYWKNMLRGAKPLNLFTDCARIDNQHINNKASVELIIDETINSKLMRLSAQYHVPLFVTLLAAYKVFLYRYTTQEDICVGSIALNPNQTEQIDNDINSLVFRTEIIGSNSFITLLQNVNSVVEAVYQYQNSDFEEIINNLDFEQGQAVNPLTQVMFIMQNEFELLEDCCKAHTSNSDIAFVLKETATLIHGKVEYNADLYKEETIKRFINQYTVLLQSICAQPDSSINTLPMLSKEEEHKLLVELNDTEVAYPKDKSLVDLFEEQVNSTPNNLAVIYDDIELSYHELNSLSNQFADYLRKKYYIQPEDLVGLMLERSEWMIIAILGILKAGGAYVPIDPEYPQERISYMIADSACKVLIDEAELEQFKNSKYDLSKENQSVGLQPHHLVYCIYTSGSTGNPKGVLVEHRNVVNLVWTQCVVYNITADERILQFNTITFDPSVEQFWIALLSGAALVVLNKASLNDIRGLEEYIIDKKITHVDTVPSYLAELSISDMSNVKRVISGGESCSPSLAHRWKANGVFINAYGPTETTITSIAYKAQETDNYNTNVPIGRPVANTQVYILDEHLHLVPFGALGEICIGGDGVSRGYLNRPELTAEKFIDNIYKPGTLNYRTGDLGRWLSDGNMEYQGRIDDQVKVRGYRIELDEVINIIQKHPKVNTAVVLAKAIRGQDKELIAYTTGDVEAVELRDYLKEQLPSYMVPGYYVQLDVMPLTPNGKIDKKVLPLPESTGLIDAEYIAPSTDIEKALAMIWADVLTMPVEMIGLKSDFFDLGGHSIKAIRLRGQLHKELGIRPSLKELFSESTIERQAQLISSRELNIYETKELVAEQPDYELSSAQRRVWVLQQLNYTESGYNLPLAMVFDGDLDKSALKKAFNHLIARHEILRTVFKEDRQGNPRQQIITTKAFNFKLKETDLRKLPDNEAALKNLVDKDLKEKFNLSKGPLLHVHLIQLDVEKHVLVIVHHHTISDEWSMDIFRKELSVCYNAYVEGETPQLPALKIQYKDYAAWHNQELVSDDIAPHKAYWLKQFEEEVPILELPADKERPAVKTFNGASLTITIDKGVLDELNKTGKALGGTLFMTLMACVNTLFYRYTGQEDIVVGSPTAGREHPDLEEQIGFYINTLTLRTRFDGRGSFADLYQQIKEVTLGAYEHQLYPYDELVEALELPRNINRNPLFDVMVVLQNSVELDAACTLNDITTSRYKIQDFQLVKLDATFLFSETASGLECLLEYNTDIYSTEQMQKMLQHFVNIVSSVIKDTHQSLSKIDFLTSEDKHQLLYVLNNTTVPYSDDKTIVDLFEEQVRKSPQSKAVVYHDIVLNYEELNSLSNQFADYLRKNYHIKPDDLVGIMLERSEWMIVVIIGILKSGGAYVPIAPDYPQERINYLVDDSGCKVLINEDILKTFIQSQAEYSQQNQSIGLQPHNLAYCIYTSGSTGNPKGCLLQHSGLVNRLEWMQKAYPLTANDVILQKTTFSFDVSVWELLWWSIEGASVCMLQPGGEKNPEAIIDAIEKHHATVMHFVPSMLSVFLEFIEDDAQKVNQLKSLKQVFTSGEALTLSQAERFNHLFPDKALMNLYGPTEASIDVTYFDCKKETLKGTVPIGKPIDNTQIYIVDKFRNLVPIGAVGEICLGGVGLARGYLNRPELTAEKFIQNPFNTSNRIYRTGDLGRWMPDGNIEYLGRIDDQVKIRGFRIELDEISSVLQKHPNVKDAIVVAKEINRQEKELVAYYTGDAGIAELKEYLKELLPIYMVPLYYVLMDAIPLTSNGKVNRKALPMPQGIGNEVSEYIAPSSEIEKTLVKIWSEVLGISEENISIRSDFFDLGGHSIKAIRLLGLIHKHLGVKLQLKELFSENTIEQQAVIVNSRERKAYRMIDVISELPTYNLSSAQRRLWVLNYFDGAQNAYNIPYVILLEGKLNKNALSQSFKAIAARHEILRTVLREDSEGAAYQQIINADEYVVGFKETDLRAVADKKVELDRLVDEENFGAFDFSNGPLWRCHLIQLEADKYILTMVHHHIISDGWSMDVFRKEWCKIYNAFTEGVEPQLSALKIQYKDYAAWHNQQLASEEIIPHKAYWLKQFEGEIPILELPADKERPSIKTFNGANLTATIDKKVSNKLEQTGKTLGATLFMTLLACVKTLFYRYTGQEDIVIGSPAAGREHPDLENQIGFYINTLALRTRFDGAGTFTDLLYQIKEITLGAYEHQLYPYDELVEALKLPRNINRNPLFDVMVVLQNSMEQDAEFTLNNLQTSLYEEGEYRVAKFDINFIFSESKGGLDLFLEYNTDIYSTEQMQRMLNHFVNIVSEVIQDSKQKLLKIDFLTQDDKRQLLQEFNNTIVDYPKQKTLTDLFEEQVLKTPDGVALRQHDKEMSYAQLNAQANQLARYLVESGVQKGDNIGLLVTRGFDMIVGMYAILKAGGAYVPIDPEYPIDRQEYILENSSVIKVVTDGDYPLEQIAAQGMFVKLKAIDLSAYSTDNLGLKIDSQQLAYTIYTSGSTGRPKGVMIEHHSAVNLVLWVNTEFNVDANDRLLFITSMCFDLSVYDIFGILAAGGSLVIVQQHELLDLSMLKDMMLKHKITFWDSVPTTIDYLVRELEANDPSYLQNNLRVVFMSGDWIPVNLPDRIRKYFPNTQVISLGGATEGTVWSNFYPIKEVNSKWPSIPYGRPMNNNFFYILNEELQLAPIGVAGELYIGGVGVARGYANDKEKTDYAFVKDPFNDMAGGRMYRTGDLGRMLPDLNMEFIGRKDNQVKIRGFRVELGEIESVLRQCEMVNQVVVIAKAYEGKKKVLVSYIVGNANYDRASVIAFLKTKLPDYMVPSLWMEIDAIPLTSNGKIDRKALPEINTDGQIKEQYVAPKTDTQKVLVAIWEDVLKVNNIGISHDFFDLGGHSLLAVQIVNQIKRKTGRVLPISLLFRYSTIEALDAYFNENGADKEVKSLIPIKPSGSKPPIYFIHGVGLNVMNFADTAAYLDAEQPVYGLQALGLGGEKPTLNTLADAAKIYVDEIIEHNPTGPYYIAGYSLGGFIALEMRKQFEARGKEIKVLAMIDTNADHTEAFLPLLPKKIKRRLSRYTHVVASFIRNPSNAIAEQKELNREEREYRYDAIKIAKESGDKEHYYYMRKLRDMYFAAFNKLKITPFNNVVYLFRAHTCLHYTNDKQYLGWKKYAQKGVKEYEISGDHRTMLLRPNAEAFAKALQQVLDNS